MKTAKIYKLGRSPECDLVLDHITISRLHAEFFIDPQSNVFLTDLQSSYGTFVNSKQIAESVLLEVGDIVTFGDEQFFDWEHIFLASTPKHYSSQKKIKKETNIIANFKDYKDVWIIYLIDAFLLLLLYVIM
jgi:pSer/pThr/pTyr-binding forkhead associated (FHA) protein